MAVPGLPPAISASSITDNSFFVSMADGATGGKPITVRQMGLSTSSSGIQQTFNTGSTYTMQPLSPSTTYYVWARCGNADGWGGWAGPISARTLASNTPPPPPPAGRPGPVPAISLGTIDNNSVFVSFQDGNPNGSPITVRQIAFGYTPDSTQFIYNTSGTTATISSLQPGMRYYFQARVGNAYGWGDWSYNVEAVTLKTALPPDPPAAISLGSIDADSIFVSFQDGDPNGSPITVRQIAFGTTEGSTTGIWNPGSGTTATIQPLQPGTRYYFMARVGNALGWSGWSASVAGTTLPARPPNAPPAIAVSSITGTSVFVSFQDGYDNGSPITVRQISYGLTPDSVSAVVNTGAERTATISSLTPRTQYYFQARVGNRYGWSPWSTNVAAKTISTPPGPATAVTFTNVTTRSVDAKFTHVSLGTTTGSPILEMQLGYGTNPSAPTTIITSNGTSTITELTPAFTYYFWARARNEAGWGPWGPVSRVTLASGVFVIVDGQPRPAIAYMTINGVPRMVEPWVKLSGVWRSM